VGRIVRFRMPQHSLTNVRAHLRTDRRLLSQYTYLERRREIGLTKLGKVELGPEKVFQVYPGLDPDDTYRRINNEVWLPAEARFNASGRALVRKFHVESVVEYSDYKKFSVETDTAFKLPK
jgi:hypothetical protein